MKFGKKVYLAAPSYNEMERIRNGHAASILRANGYDICTPKKNDPWGNVNALKECNFVMAFLDGAMPDPGVSWEMGYAFALSKPIQIILHDDRCIANDYTIILNSKLRGSCCSICAGNINDWIAEEGAYREQ